MKRTEWDKINFDNNSLLVVDLAKNTLTVISGKYINTDIAVRYYDNIEMAWSYPTNVWITFVDTLPFVNILTAPVDDVKSQSIALNETPLCVDKVKQESAIYITVKLGKDVLYSYKKYPVIKTRVLEPEIIDNEDYIWAQYKLEVTYATGDTQIFDKCKTFDDLKAPEWLHPFAEEEIIWEAECTHFSGIYRLSPKGCFVRPLKDKMYAPDTELQANESPYEAKEVPCSINEIDLDCFEAGGWIPEPFTTVYNMYNTYGFDKHKILKIASEFEERQRVFTLAHRTEILAKVQKWVEANKN